MHIYTRTATWIKNARRIITKRDTKEEKEKDDNTNTTLDISPSLFSHWVLKQIHNAC